MVVANPPWVRAATPTAIRCGNATAGFYDPFCGFGGVLRKVEYGKFADKDIKERVKARMVEDMTFFIDNGILK